MSCLVVFVFKYKLKIQSTQDKLQLNLSGIENEEKLHWREIPEIFALLDFLNVLIINVKGDFSGAGTITVWYHNINAWQI